MERGDPGLYGPGSEAWRLNREAMLLLGAGPRALLMQIAHPAVAAGVDQHSDFRTDPWGRLAATLRSYLTIVYGSGAVARAEIRRLNALHRGIVGAGYSARDPELSMWVHATLIDSTIVANDAWIEPLPRARRAAFYLETRPIGRAFGVPDGLLPADLDGFEAYLERMLAPDGPVQVSPTARDLAEVILHPPLAPLARWLPPGSCSGAAVALARVPAAVYDWTLWPAVGLLPASIRAGYGLPWGLPERLVSRWLAVGWRAWCPLLPAAFRQMPHALAADRRVEASGTTVHDAWNPRAPARRELPGQISVVRLVGGSLGGQVAGVGLHGVGIHRTHARNRPSERATGSERLWDLA